MFKTMSVIGALASSALLLAGCETRRASTPAKSARLISEKDASTTLANTGRVTLHVKDMRKRLNIT
jgi:outer membrane murein-binding lipoprotein Lpp